VPVPFSFGAGIRNHRSPSPRCNLLEYRRMSRRPGRLTMFCARPAAGAASERPYEGKGNGNGKDKGNGKGRGKGKGKGKSSGNGFGDFKFQI
jgi:hypothetical protein